MENNEFDRFSSAWKKSASADSQHKIYHEKDINTFKMKSSTDFSRTLNNSIIFDIIHKSILILAMLLLLWFFRTDLFIVLAIILLTCLSIFLIFQERSIKLEFRKIDDYTKDVSTTISEKIRFFRSHSMSLQWMMAFTNGLLVWVGSLFYFYSKYGYYRIDDLADVIVNLLMVSLAIGISFYSYNYQNRFNLLELEENLADLDDEGAAAIHMQNQTRRKRRMKIVLILLSIVGLLSLLYLVIIYLLQVG